MPSIHLPTTDFYSNLDQTSYCFNVINSLTTLVILGNICGLVLVFTLLSFFLNSLTRSRDRIRIIGPHFLMTHNYSSDDENENEEDENDDEDDEDENEDLEEDDDDDDDEDEDDDDDEDENEDENENGDEDEDENGDLEDDDEYEYENDRTKKIRLGLQGMIKFIKKFNSGDDVSDEDLESMIEFTSNLGKPNESLREIELKRFTDKYRNDLVKFYQTVGNFYKEE